MINLVTKHIDEKREHPLKESQILVTCKPTNMDPCQEWYEELIPSEELLQVFVNQRRCYGFNDIVPVIWAMFKNYYICDLHEKKPWAMINKIVDRLFSGECICLVYDDIANDWVGILKEVILAECECRWMEKVYGK